MGEDVDVVVIGAGFGGLGVERDAVVDTAGRRHPRWARELTERFRGTVWDGVGRRVRQLVPDGRRARHRELARADADLPPSHPASPAGGLLVGNPCHRGFVPGALTRPANSPS